MSSETSNPTKPTLLVVDDTPDNIAVLSNLLRDSHRIKVATNGRRALEIAEAGEPPDLILLDIMMPEMDGYEVCQRLKQSEALRDIPVIFLSALNEAMDKVRAFESGGVDYVTKPFQAEEVRARVQTHLTLQAARRRLAEQNQQLIEAAKLREDVERITRHDLKNPLQMIIGAPVLIKLDENLTDQQRGLLDGISKAGYRMLEMINSSLDLYKMERGVYQFQPVNVNLVAVIDSIREEMARLTETKKLNLEILVGSAAAKVGDVFEVWGEELLCYSMLANLIKNAIEASPTGATVTVALGGDAPRTVGIHNPGAVPEQIRETFFEKYATAGKQQGTGLGTYSARLIAETQGGAIRMRTSEAEGTTITVELQRPSGA